VFLPHVKSFPQDDRAAENFSPQAIWTILLEIQKFHHLGTLTRFAGPQSTPVWPQSLDPQSLDLVVLSAGKGQLQTAWNLGKYLSCNNMEKKAQ
jgi:hypothetical protein